MKTNAVPVPVATHDEREAGTEVSWPSLHTLPTPQCSENSRLWVWLCLSQSGSGLKGAVPAQTERASSNTSIQITHCITSSGSEHSWLHSHLKKTLKITQAVRSVCTCSTSGLWSCVCTLTRNPLWQNQPQHHFSRSYAKYSQALAPLCDSQNQTNKVGILWSIGCHRKQRSLQMTQWMVLNLLVNNNDWGIENRQGKYINISRTVSRHLKPFPVYLQKDAGRRGWLQSRLRRSQACSFFSV